MTDFFTRLAEHLLGQAPVVEPTIAARFAPGRPLVGEGSSEDVEAHGLEQGAKVLSERGAPTDPSPDLLSAQVEEEASSSFGSRRIGTPTSDRAVPGTEGPPEHGLTSGEKEGLASDSSLPDPLSAQMPKRAPSSVISTKTPTFDRAVPGTEGPPEHGLTSREKEGRHSLSSPSPYPVAAARPWGQKRPFLDAVSTRPPHAGSDGREPIETMGPKNGMSSKYGETFSSISPVVPTHDSSSMDRSSGTAPPLLKPLGAQAHHHNVSWKATEKMPLSEPLSSPPSPTIQVTIGRVEVRAVMPPAQPTQAKPTRSAPSLSLEDYLKQRNEGRK
jgi:hypothetical protein